MILSTSAGPVKLRVWSDGNRPAEGMSRKKQSNDEAEHSWIRRTWSKLESIKVSQECAPALVIFACRTSTAVKVCKRNGRRESFGEGEFEVMHLVRLIDRRHGRADRFLKA